MKFYNFKRARCAGHGGYANKTSGRPLRSGKLSPRSAPVSALGGDAAGGLAGVHTPRRAETRVSDVLCMCMSEFEFCYRLCCYVEKEKKNKKASDWHQIHDRGSSLRWVEGFQSLTISFFLNCVVGAQVFCLSVPCTSKMYTLEYSAV